MGLTSRMKLSTKIILLGSSIALVMAAINIYTIPYISKTVYSEKRLKTRHLVETAVSLVNHYVGQAKSGVIETKEAQAAAKNAVKALRYETKDYFWINDFEAKMVMHPIKPALDGKDLSQFKDPKGKLLFVEFAKVARDKGAGFVDYLWPKPGNEKPVQKISYVKGIPEWSWVIGSGIYVDDVERQINRLVYVILVLAVGVFLLAVVLSWFLGRSLTRPLIRVVSTLSQGSAEITQASKQVSDSSQTLAEGSSEQAASLEETSSSLEELSSLTKSTAENAETADQVMIRTRDTISKAGEEMNEIARSMDKIAASGEEIGKIVKSIDEIAFQTNLLALNAAVEAARAGEAGAGFAVVADEVRSLAMRAAEAAKNTQSLVEETVKSITHGSEIVETTKTGFSALVSSSKEAVELVSQIASASGEQAQGIDQINQAISQVDQVVQANAATAEESASASEEMSSQAIVINKVVSNLMNLIGITEQAAPAAPEDRPQDLLKFEQGRATGLVATDADDLGDF